MKSDEATGEVGRRRLNRKRLALSCALIGMIALPLWTGNAKRFVAKPVIHYVEIVEDNRTPFLIAHGLSEYSCEIDLVAGKPRSDICAKADAIENKIAYRTELNGYELSWLLRDLLLGFTVPGLVVLIGPTLARKYARWLTG